jgi:hypothetical protein
VSIIEEAELLIYSRGLLVVYLEFEFIEYTNLIFAVLLCIEFVGVSTEESGLVIEMRFFFYIFTICKLSRVFLKQSEVLISVM